MDHKKNHHKNREYTVKISETNRILQKYRNSALTYDLIRKIVHDMNESTNAPMNAPMKMDNDVRMIYD